MTHRPRRGKRSSFHGPRLLLLDFVLRARHAPHRALVNRAAQRLGHSASIPRTRYGGPRWRHSIPSPAGLCITVTLLRARYRRSRDRSRSRVPPDRGLCSRTCGCRSCGLAPVSGSDSAPPCSGMRGFHWASPTGQSATTKSEGGADFRDGLEVAREARGACHGDMP